MSFWDILRSLSCSTTSEFNVAKPNLCFEDLLLVTILTERPSAVSELVILYPWIWIKFYSVKEKIYAPWWALVCSSQSSSVFMTSTYSVNRKLFFHYQWPSYYFRFTVSTYSNEFIKSKDFTFSLNSLRLLIAVYLKII